MNSIEPDLLKSIPHLRAFAISLTADREKADDLVQETMLRALTHMNQFQPGTNLQAWLTTILRNQFYTVCRKYRRESEDPDGLLASRLTVLPNQDARLDYQDMLTALAKLPPRQREAIILIGADGRSYEEAAAICNTSIGTVKSRVNRARTRLAKALGLTNRPGVTTDLLPSPNAYQAAA